MKPLLFIGDPHVTSSRVGRRLDDYAAAVLDKIRQCVDLANNNDASIVILGDLFDRPRESDIGLLSALIGEFKRCRNEIICLAGNHDKAGTTLTEDTTLAMLGRAGVLRVIDKPASIYADDVLLHCYPHGFDVPANVTAGKRLTVVVTHHDWAIPPNTVPSAKALRSIEGCDLVINGHDHTSKPPAQVGSTTYFNPGNISRVSIAQLHHVPCVYMLHEQGACASAENTLFSATPGDEVLVLNGFVLQRFTLAHEHSERVFDLTGYAQHDGEKISADEALALLMSSFSQTSQQRFVEALRSTHELQAASGEGVVAQIVRQVMDDMNVDPSVREIVEGVVLADEAV